MKTALFLLLFSSIYYRAFSLFSNEKNIYLQAI